MKKILLIATGGTIASKYTADGLAPQISAEELLEYIPEAKEFCTIDTVQPFALDSTNVCADHWLKLARLIESKYEFYDGFGALPWNRYHGIYSCGFVLSYSAITAGPL